MEISVSTGLYYKRDHISILDILKASGAKNIEIALNQSFIDVPVEVIKKAVDERGLKVTSIHLPLTFIAYARDEDEAYWINKGLEYLNVLEADVLVTHFFYKNGEGKISNDESHFANIVHYTKTSGKFVTTENLPKMNLETLHQNTEKLNTFLSKNDCYLTYDTTHVATHNKCIIEEYKIFKDRIRNIHLSDFLDGAEHKLLGEGDLPLKEFIKTLKDDHYKYPVTLEFDFENPTRNKLMTDNEAVEAISNSIKYIESVN